MNNNIIQEIGSAVATRRQALGLTQEQLAEAAGISANMLGQIERGAVENTSIKLLHKIAQALHGHLTCRLDGFPSVVQLVIFGADQVFASLGRLLEAAVLTLPDDAQECLVTGRVQLEDPDWGTHITCDPIVTAAATWRIFLPSRTLVPGEEHAHVAIRLRKVA